MAEAAGTGPGGAAAARPLVVWNPAAGRRAVAPNDALDEPALRELLARHGIEADVAPTASAAEALDLGREARATGRRLVIVAGGDGTFRAVARTLVGSGPDGPAIGILPLGSVMNVGRSLGIPRDLEAAAAVVAGGRVREMDVGVAAGEPFFEAAAIGIHAALFAQGERLDRGDLLAPLRGAWIAIRYRPSRMTIRLDDRTLTTKALAVSVANGPYSGLGFTLAPGAVLDDGRLDVRVFERFSRWELARHFVSIVAGRRRYEPRVATYRSRTVRIGSVSALPARADGEPLGTTPVEIEVIPRALRVVVPDRA